MVHYLVARARPFISSRESLSAVASREHARLAAPQGVPRSDVVTEKYAAPGKVFRNDGSSHHSYQKRPTLKYGAIPSALRAPNTPNNTGKRAGATSHTYRLWRHVLRPSTGGARTGAIAYGGGAEAVPRPRSRAPPGAFERPRRGAGARVARGHLQPPSAGSGEPEHASVAAQPAPPPASCTAAPQQHARLARSEATRRRRSAQASQSSRRSSCTCQ